MHVLEEHPSDWRIFLSGGWDGRVCLWNMFTGELLQHFQANRAVPASVGGDLVGSAWSTMEVTIPNPNPNPNHNPNPNPNLSPNPNIPNPNPLSYPNHHP